MAKDLHQEFKEIVSLTRRYIEQEMGLEEGDCLKEAAEGAPLDPVRGLIADCKKCSLWTSRTNIVLGAGNEEADLVIIGEAPGNDEDVAGEPFVGRAGKLLTKMLGAVKISREEVYITNVVKCRPPQNRDPKEEEISSCSPYLSEQLKILKPKLILTLGNFATRTLLKTTEGITQLRGKIFSYEGIPLLPTFHPSALLHNPNLKKYAWEDLKRLRKEVDRLKVDRL